jgi:hypothetical protein
VRDDLLPSVFPDVAAEIVREHAEADR